MGALRCLCPECGCADAFICRTPIQSGPCGSNWYAIIIDVFGDVGGANCQQIIPAAPKRYLLFRTNANQWDRAPHPDGIAVRATGVPSVMFPSYHVITSLEFTRGADTVTIEWPTIVDERDCTLGNSAFSLITSTCSVRCIKLDIGGVLSARWYDIQSLPLAVRLDATISGAGGAPCNQSWSDVLPLAGTGLIYDGWAAGAGFRRGNPNEHFFGLGGVGGIGAGSIGAIFGSFFPDDWPTNPFCNVGSGVFGFPTVDLCGRKDDAFSPTWPTFTTPNDVTAGCSACVPPDSATVTITEL